ncbi:hypothetical protein AN958_03959 [Leucoagaricus sp. SymC.cos]|nr:hypothetical protein AN958_03959 [Leucoagaricus sp. SymC.cos]
MVVFMILSGVGSGQTLQTTTVAVQASVPRKDMSVVTAFRNVGSHMFHRTNLANFAVNAFQFMRMLGGTLALAVGATLMLIRQSVLCD